MTNSNESSIPLYLDIKSQEDNLYAEYDGSRPCLYYINGMMSEDEHVFTFSQEAELIHLDGRTVIDSINSFDVDHMLDLYIALFEDEYICVSHYESKKLRNLNKLENGLFEVPLTKTIYIENKDMTEPLMYYVYMPLSEIDLQELIYECRKAFTYFKKEAEAVYQEGILFNEKYDDFMEEINHFIRKYKVEFEQSEGSEMIISTIYVLRKYLNLDWKHVYELLKEQ